MMCKNLHKGNGLFALVPGPVVSSIVTGLCTLRVRWTIHAWMLFNVYILIDKVLCCGPLIQGQVSSSDCS